MISIIVTGFNKPEFVEIQYKLCKKFVEDEFEYFLYDNSNNPKTSFEFEGVCKKIGANYIKIPNNGGCPSTRAGYSLYYAIKNNHENYNKPIMVLDSDLFPIKNISTKDFFEKADMIGVCDSRVSGDDEYKKYIESKHKGPEEGLNIENNNYIYYFRNQFLILNMDKLKDFTKTNLFSPARTNGFHGDCGCLLHDYFLNTKTKHFSLDVERLRDMTKQNPLFEYFSDEAKIIPNGYSEVFKNFFLHFRSGSNWQNHSENTMKEREKNLFKHLNIILNQ